jgi:putative transposase
MRTAFKCRAYPTGVQAANLARTFGCVRKVGNETLAWRHQRWYGERLSTNVPEANAPLTASLSLGTRRWTCPTCGTRHDRDENAAKNILAAGLAVALRGDACGGDVRHSGSCRVQSPTKQEPPAARPRIPVLQGGE